jgi:Holliday junction DNA helicase RuvB
VVNRLLRRVRDFADVADVRTIDRGFADRVLERLGIDRSGLDDMCRRILQTLITQFGGGPAGLDSIAAACGEDPGTVEEVYEPYLIQQGMMARTPRGRMALRSAYEHLGVPFKGTRELF